MQADEIVFAREGQFDEFMDLVVGFLVVHPYFGNVRAEVIADGTGGQPQFLIYDDGSLFLLGVGTDIRPQPVQVFEIAFKCRLGLSNGGGPGDEAYAFGCFEGFERLLQACSFLFIFDFAGHSPSGCGQQCRRSCDRAGTDRMSGTRLSFRWVP